MKILLINPPSTDPFVTRRDVPPLGIAYVAAFAQTQGHEVRLIDTNVGGGLGLGASDVLRLSNEERWDIVGISSTTAGFRDSVALSAQIKAAQPQALIVYGGHHATSVHQQLLERYPEVDVVVRGEGEVTLCEIANRMAEGRGLAGVLGTTYRNVGTVIANPARSLIDDLDVLPFPARDLLPPSSAYAANYDFDQGGAGVVGTVVSSRGCPYSCSFCSVHAFYVGASKKWRARSCKNVADEIEEMTQQYGVEYVGFVDDNFFVQPERAVGITAELKQRGCSIPFSFATRSDQIIRGRAHLPALKAAGCTRIELGIESGSDRMLQRFNKNVSVAQNGEAIDIIRENNIIVKCDVIMFDPDTIIEDLSETLCFLKRHNLYGQYPPLIYSYLGLLPGTDYHVRMEQQGRAGEAVSQPADWEFSDIRTAEVFRATQRFFQEYQLRLDEVIRDFEDCFFSAKASMRELANGSRRWRELEKVCSDCFLNSVLLKRRPHHFLEALLSAGGHAQATRAAYEKLAERTGAQIQMAEETLKAVREAVGTSG